MIRKKPIKGRRKNSGRVIIVEIKDERERKDSIDGEQGRKALALRKWEELNPEQLKYEMIFTNTDVITADQLQVVKNFIEEE